ncbi:MAG: rRNA pseudouridine synthase [Dehalococcoidia bacterium]|nr:rRNA pseudouridine synthase [Dehalococcoidia bacterium]
MESIPLLRYMVEAGLGARRQVVAAIKVGRVAVNGKQAESYTMPVYPQADRITFDGKPVSFHARARIVLMLNKPLNLLTTTSDDRGRQTVLDILPAEYRGLGLYPVGRLDHDTTGLLLLTNDGNLTYRLTHPRFELGKEYLVHIEATLSRQEKDLLEKGVLLDDGATAPAGVKEVNYEPPYNYSITIHEGRNRQVRRMFAHLGYTVKALKRVRMGNLRLGDLAEGSFRRLSVQEIASALRQHKQ